MENQIVPVHRLLEVFILVTVTALAKKISVLYELRCHLFALYKFSVIKFFLLKLKVVLLNAINRKPLSSL